MHNLIKYFVTEVKARRQPSLWVRQTTGNTVVVAYCNITALSYDGGTNDIITGSVEFKPYDGSTVDVSSIEDLTLTTDISATKSVATGATLTLGPVVAAGGVEPYTYQWYKGTTPISDSGMVTTGMIVERIEPRNMKITTMTMMPASSRVLPTSQIEALMNSVAS